MINVLIIWKRNCNIMFFFDISTDARNLVSEVISCFPSNPLQMTPFMSEDVRELFNILFSPKISLATKFHGNDSSFCCQKIHIFH